MPELVLLDTFILKEMGSPLEFNGYLKQIISWHEKEDVTVLCGNTLKAE